MKCGAYDLSEAGKKDDLINRLFNYLNREDSEDSGNIIQRSENEGQSQDSRSPSPNRVGDHHNGNEEDDAEAREIQSILSSLSEDEDFPPPTALVKESDPTRPTLLTGNMLQTGNKHLMYKGIRMICNSPPTITKLCYLRIPIRETPKTI